MESEEEYMIGLKAIYSEELYKLTLIQMSSI